VGFTIAFGTCPEHLRLPLVLSRVPAARSLVFRVVILYIVVCPFVIFSLAIVLSALFLFTDSYYPFGIFKLVIE
jgi:hypothetical protein